MSEEQNSAFQFKNPAQKEKKMPTPQFKKPAPLFAAPPKPTEIASQFKKSPVEWPISPIPQETKPVNPLRLPPHASNTDPAQLPTLAMPIVPPPVTPPLAVHPSSPPETPRPAFTDPQVEQYYVWLEQNNAVTIPDAVLQTYEHAALEIKHIGSQSIRTFAPFREELSAFHVITKNQIITLILLFCGWLIGLLFFQLTMVTATIGAITLLYIFGFLTSSILVTKSSRKKSGEWIDEKIIHTLDQLGAEWPTYTILCPLFKEVAVVPQFVEAMLSLSYPAQKLQVLFLTEQSDAQTRIALEQMRLPPRANASKSGKGGSKNSAFLRILSDSE